MYNSRKGAVYVECGSLFNQNGIEIQNPALLIDGNILVAYGGLDIVNQKFEKVVNINRQAGINCNELVLISFDRYAHEDFGIDDICYIFRRAIEFTATQFIKNLVENWGTDEFISWIKREQKKLPICDRGEGEREDIVKDCILQRW